MPTKQIEPATQGPVPIGTQTATADGKTYEIWKYKDGPNLAQIRKIGKEMPRVDEARLVLKDILKPGQWAYVKDSDLEKNDMAWSVGMNDNGELFESIVTPNHAAPVVILKSTGAKVGQEPASSMIRL